MTTKTKNKKLNLASAQTSLPAVEAANVNNLTPIKDAVPGETLHLNITTEGLKAITLLASSLLFAAPAFATQANPQNIVSLADMFYRYAVGSIMVNQPSDAVANVPAPTTTVFG